MTHAVDIVREGFDIRFCDLRPGDLLINCQMSAIVFKIDSERIHVMTELGVYEWCDYGVMGRKLMNTAWQYLVRLRQEKLER